LDEQTKNQIKNFKEYLQQKGRRPATINLYTTIITKFFTEYTEKNYIIITNQDIDKYISWLTTKEEIRHQKKLTGRGQGRLSQEQGKLKATTINTNLSAIKKFMYYSQKNEIASNIELAKVPKWTPQIIDLQIIEELFKSQNFEEIKKIVEITWKKRQKDKEEPINEFYIERDTLLIAILFNEGIRIGEASNIKKSDFNFTLSKPILIVSGKTGQRTLLLSESMTTRVKDFLKKYMFIKDYFFCSASGGGLSVNTLKTYVWEIFRFGLGHKYHAHTLRHAYTTFLLDKGYSLKQVSDSLGHTNINTTARYLDVIQGKNIKPLSPIDDIQKSGDY